MWNGVSRNYLNERHGDPYSGFQVPGEPETQWFLVEWNLKGEKDARGAVGDRPGSTNGLVILVEQPHPFSATATNLLFRLSVIGMTD